YTLWPESSMRLRGIARYDEFYSFVPNTAADLADDRSQPVECRAELICAPGPLIFAKVGSGSPGSRELRRCRRRPSPACAALRVLGGPGQRHCCYLFWPCSLDPRGSGLRDPPPGEHRDTPVSACPIILRRTHKSRP